MSKKVNVQIVGEIFVTDTGGTAVTGLVNANFTKRLSKDGANDSTTVTVTEIANGRYSVTWTPTVTGHYELLVIHATYNPYGWTESFDVTTDGELTAAQVTAAVPTAAAVRAEIDSNSTQLAAILTTLAAVPAGVWNYVVGVSFTAKRYLKAAAAAVAGKTSGGPSGFIARDLEDTQDQIVGTANSDGDRTPTSYGS